MLAFDKVILCTLDELHRLSEPDPSKTYGIFSTGATTKTLPIPAKASTSDIRKILKNQLLTEIPGEIPKTVFIKNSLKITAGYVDGLTTTLSKELARAFTLGSFLLKTLNLSTISSKPAQLFVIRLQDTDESFAFVFIGHHEEKFQRVIVPRDRQEFDSEVYDTVLQISREYRDCSNFDLFMVGFPEDAQFDEYNDIQPKLLTSLSMDPSKLPSSAWFRNQKQLFVKTFATLFSGSFLVLSLFFTLFFLGKCTFDLTRYSVTKSSIETKLEELNELETKFEQVREFDQYPSYAASQVFLDNFLKVIQDQPIDLIDISITNRHFEIQMILWTLSTDISTAQVRQFEQHLQTQLSPAIQLTQLGGPIIQDDWVQVKLQLSGDLNEDTNIREQDSSLSPSTQSAKTVQQRTEVVSISSFDEFSEQSSEKIQSFSTEPFEQISITSVRDNLRTDLQSVGNCDRMFRSRVVFDHNESLNPFSKNRHSNREIQNSRGTTANISKSIREFFFQTINTGFNVFGGVAYAAGPEEIPEMERDHTRQFDPRTSEIPGDFPMDLQGEPTNYERSPEDPEFQSGDTTKINESTVDPNNYNSRDLRSSEIISPELSSPSDEQLALRAAYQEMQRQKEEARQRVQDLERRQQQRLLRTTIFNPEKYRVTAFSVNSVILTDESSEKSYQFSLSDTFTYDEQVFELREIVPGKKVIFHGYSTGEKPERRLLFMPELGYQETTVYYEVEPYQLLRVTSEFVTLLNTDTSRTVTISLGEELSLEKQQYLLIKTVPNKRAVFQTLVTEKQTTQSEIVYLKSLKISEELSESPVLNTTFNLEPFQLVQMTLDSITLKNTESSTSYQFQLDDTFIFNDRLYSLTEIIEDRKAVFYSEATQVSDPHQIVFIPGREIETLSAQFNLEPYTALEVTSTSVTLRNTKTGTLSTFLLGDYLIVEEDGYFLEKLSPGKSATFKSAETTRDQIQTLVYTERRAPAVPRQLYNLKPFHLTSLTEDLIVLYDSEEERHLYFEVGDLLVANSRMYTLRRIIPRKAAVFYTSETEALPEHELIYVLERGTNSFQSTPDTPIFSMYTSLDDVFGVSPAEETESSGKKTKTTTNKSDSGSSKKTDEDSLESTDEINDDDDDDD